MPTKSERAKVNWHIVLIGLAVTVAASVVQFVVVRAVPNYDDEEYVPPFVVAMALGTALSFVAGYLV